MDKIQYYADLYYNHDTSEISDAEYDALVRNFRADRSAKQPFLKGQARDSHALSG